MKTVRSRQSALSENLLLEPWAKSTLEELRAAGSRTVEQIAQISCVSTDTARTRLRKLAAAELVVEERTRQGNGQLRLYRLNGPEGTAAALADGADDKAAQGRAADLVLKSVSRQYALSLSRGVKLDPSQRRPYLTRKILKLSPVGLAQLNRIISDAETEMAALEEQEGDTVSVTIVLT
jgi:DNA-binding transcriptional ArsR family regulator